MDTISPNENKRTVINRHNRDFFLLGLTSQIKFNERWNSEKTPVAPIIIVITPNTFAQPLIDAALVRLIVFSN